MSKDKGIIVSIRERDQLNKQIVSVKASVLSLHEKFEEIFGEVKAPRKKRAKKEKIAPSTEQAALKVAKAEGNIRPLKAASKASKKNHVDKKRVDADLPALPN
jgi:uncharacterized coiled-coil DUF342 family protein